MTPSFELVGLVAADMGASLEFYRRLGLSIPPEADTQPHVEAELAPGVRLAWDTVDTVRSFDPDWEPPKGGSPRASLAFRCDSPAEVDRVYHELVGAGYEGSKDPWDAFWGQRYAVVHDPDGNGVDLFAALPAT
ncbi:glyoxalase/bleomycin resistance protein/dioxygenase superfamily protein [Haloactinospora alba]|uniref:Glyoxalase/bleomycin resistance protein/dioxygenase superfamily protein n=1 Tax=Haloactinospora alba TaxID=405555 RepID=A0A543NA46_9ACTN|nr:VOC family protein [Haloactinospora alba]TQN28683.1 glyoxalase/bleomycin resistance protein/dioxygenase superfamily protein [Haloactinospora alba]